MKKFFFSFFFIMIFLPGLNAQEPYHIRQALDFFNSEKFRRGETKKVLTESDIKGSPYLNEEFTEGSVYTKSRYQFVDIPLRYNIYNDEIEFKSEAGQVLTLAAPQVIEKVAFGGDTFVYLPYIPLKKVKHGFFIELESGEKASLYVRPQIQFKAATEPGAYKDPEPPKFERKPDEYYIHYGSGAAMLISRKKDLREAFESHQKEVTSFIKKNRISPNKAEELEELVRYYNSLQMKPTKP